MRGPGALNFASLRDWQSAEAGWSLSVLLVRLAWLAVGAAALGLLMVGLPGYVERLARVCVAAPCLRGELTPEGVASLAAVGLGARAYATWIALVQVVVASVFAAVGGLLIWHRPGERMAQFGAFAMLLFGGATFLGVGEFAAQAHPVLWWPATILDVVGAATFTALVFVFPNGRFVPRWTRWVALVWIAVQVPAPFFASGSGPVRTFLEAVNVPVFLVGLATAGFSQVYRYRRVSTPAQRQQTRWTAFGFTTALGSYAAAGAAQLVIPAFRDPLPLLGLSTLAYGALAILPLSVAVALLRHRLYDVDLLIGRTLVYGILTACVVGVYVLVVGYLSSRFRTEENLLISLVATGAVALLVQPLREGLQRGVNRFLYGQRDEPYAVLARLGRQLDGTGDPTAMLPAVAETIARALNLPYAAVRVAQADGSLAEAAVAGVPGHTDDPVRLPLLHQGETVGELVLGRRGHGEPFDPADRRLLDDLARQAAAAVHAVRLTADLQLARSRLVTAREEERRRLRRDLHDGLGPTLAALGLKLETARNLLGEDPRADVLLADLAERTQSAVGDIRRLVYALRPPALDERGLVGALRQAAVSFETQATDTGLRVTLTAPEHLPPLPAAVEVAAFRIAQEAVTNVVRHAGARMCQVRLAVDPDARMLRLTIEDDGIGLSDERVAGVGLASMRERAEELGGRLVVGAGSTGGTRVEATLPLPLEADSRSIAPDPAEERAA